MKTMLVKLFSWKTFSSSSPRTSSKRSLRLEPLEDRQMLAVSAADFNFNGISPFDGQVGEKIVVSSLLDENDGDYSDGNLCLREAIDLANLSSDYTEISFADGLFQDGDAIILTLGSLQITNSNIGLIGNNSGSYVTIDGDGLSGVFSVFDSTVYMTGINITGGNASHGSGIFGINSNFHLEEVGITNNHAAYHGGGVYLAGGSLTASSLFVDQNSADLNGGGLYLGSATVGIINSVICNNESKQEGGGIYQQNGQFYMLESVLQSNTAHINGGGYLSHSGDVRIEKSRITENNAGNSGSGFYHDGGANSHIYFSNSIIDMNQAGSWSSSSGYSAGEGAACYLACDAELINMTVTGNVVFLPQDEYIDGNVSGGAIFAVSGENYSTKIYNSIIFGNKNSDPNESSYVPGTDVCGTVTGVNNLIGENLGFEWLDEDTNFYGVAPKFVDAENGDYRLAGDSPAINAGNNVFADSDTDFQGYRRILGGAVDLGAYEYTEYNEWVGPDTGDWLNDACWAYGHVPQTGEKVYIPAGKTVRIVADEGDVTDTAKTIAISASDIKVEGILEIYASSTEEISQGGDESFFDGGVRFEGFLDVSGSIFLQKGSLFFQNGADISGEFIAQAQTSIYVENAPVIISGMTTIGGVHLRVNDTTLAFPNLTSYTIPEDAWGDFRVKGENGVLDFSALTAFDNHLCSDRSLFFVENGGKIDLSKLESITNADFTVLNSILALPGLTDDTLTNVNFELGNAEIVGWDNITTLDQCQIDIRYGEHVFSNLKLAIDTFFSATCSLIPGDEAIPASLSLPSLETYRLTDGNSTSRHLFAGSDGLLDFSGLKEIVMAPEQENLRLKIAVSHGGQINFSVLESVIGKLDFTADGGESVIDASNLVEQKEFTVIKTEGGQVLLAKYIPEQLIVSSLVDENDGRYFEGELSLREAIELAAIREGNTIVTFTKEITGTISLVLGELFIQNASMTILAPGITIDAQQRSRVFNIEDSTVALIGMTITNGFTSLDGGGILALDSNLKLKQVEITHCAANSNQSCGGGVFFLGITDSSMTDVVIKNNQAASGGGIGYYFDGGLTLNNVILSENLAQQGGGIYAFGSNTDTAVITMNNVRVSGNTAFQENFTGGGIFARNVRLNIKQSQITDNQAANGAGIALLGGAILTLNNSLIANNASQNYAGGIYLGALEDLPVRATLNNVTVASNRGNMGAAGIYLHDSYGNSSLTLNNTIVAGNTGNAAVDVAVAFGGNISGTHSLIGATDATLTGIVHGESGNLLNVDPVFVNPEERDYRLDVGSPAIDAGDNSVVAENAIDLDGTERITNNSVDIGAYEFTNYMSLPVFFEIDLVTDDWAFYEGDTIIVWIIRTESCSKPITIRLENGNPDMLSVPDYVTIPEGEEDLSGNVFGVTTFRDYIYGEDRDVCYIYAYAPGCIIDPIPIRLLDADIEDPASVIETVNMPESEPVNWTVRKNGNRIEIVDDTDRIVYSKDYHDFGTLEIVANDIAESTLVIDYSNEELLDLGLNIHFTGSSESVNRLEILGTDGDDVFQFSPDGNFLNGRLMPLSWVNVDFVTLDAGEGTDIFSLDTNAQQVNFTFRDGSGSLNMDGVLWDIRESEQIDISANGGRSTTARIHDTRYNDTFLLGSDSLTMTGGDSVVHVTGFSKVDAFSLNGGKDLTNITAENNSVIIMNDTFAERREGGQTTRIWYSGSVVAINGDDSNNLLIHQGSKGTDIYSWSESFGTATNSTGKYSHEMHGFNNVNIQVLHQSAAVQLPNATEETEWIVQEQKKLWISENLTLAIYGNAELFNVPVFSEPEDDLPGDEILDSQPYPATVPRQSEILRLNDEFEDAFYHFLASEQLTRKKAENDDWKTDWSEQVLFDLLYGDK